MFTGLIETTGEILEKKTTDGGMNFKVKANFTENDLKIGDSVSINGACQTVAELNADKSEFVYYSSYKTLELTNFEFLKIGDLVNLERSVRFGDRMGGHLVSGHVDAVAEVVNRYSKDAGAVEVFEIELASTEAKYSIERGSIAVDGISLTIVKIEGNRIELVLIPETLKKTNAESWKISSKVNIETDLFARYIEKLVSRTPS